MLDIVMRIIRAAERALLAIVMLVMSLLFFTNVAVREISPSHASDLAWIEEATLFALAWLVFIGLGLALERRRHIAMTAILDKLGAGAARFVHAAINVTGLLVCAFLTKISFDLAVFIYNSGQISPTLDISMLALYAPLPIGFALLALRYLLELVGAQDRFQVRDVVSEH
ncbi:TRAP transporter small permease [Microvirga massiliensis]|uniref:TRAP transporter small permease n=1 Tax=Microvirga massiliensis TaxID=1033741 RepID=UPI00062BEBFD|nr:TRAP transporter small permease subunit [Microvirga massiliensis]